VGCRGKPHLICGDVDPCLNGCDVILFKDLWNLWAHVTTDQSLCYASS
jgi:hypothetical protein